jgi:uncharacterized Tic20 family protein
VSGRRQRVNFPILYVFNNKRSVPILDEHGRSMLQYTVTLVLAETLLCNITVIVSLLSSPDAHRVLYLPFGQVASGYYIHIRLAKYAIRVLETP